MALQIRVEMKPLSYHASKDQEDRAFRGMMATFKKRVNEAGILTEYKQKQTYESKGQKRRRKSKESAARRRKDDENLKGKLREFFG